MDVVRDAFGFEVKRELHSLYLKAEKLLLREERERSDRWNSFLTSIESSASESSSATSDSRSLTVLADLLEQCLLQQGSDNDETDLQLRRQLQTLVQAGVPTEIRGKLWNMFLKTDSRKQEGLYDKLKLAAQEAAEALEARPSCDSMLRGAPSTGSLGPSAPSRMHPSSSAGNLAGSMATAPLAKSLSAAMPTGVPAGDAGSPRGRPGGRNRPASAQVTATISCKSLPNVSTSPGRSCSPRMHNSPSCQSLSEAGATTCASLSSAYSNRADVDRAYSTVDWHSQIDKDLHRTFPGHISMNEDGRQSLKNILSAYSMWNPFVGYCQGMNFIAGVLLLFMNEEDAFWCLATVVEERLPGYFSVAMVAPQVDQLVLQALVEEYFPTLTELFKRHGMDVISVSMQWFLCMYINSLPLETALRVWDILFFDASPVILFRVALALLDIYQKSILSTEDSMECMELLAQIPSMSFDGSRLIDVACIAFDSITEEKVYILREQCRERILERVRDLPQHVEMLSARACAHPSILQQGNPEEVATLQLFGCEMLPQAYLPKAVEECSSSTEEGIEHQVVRPSSSSQEVDMTALIANMRKQILGKMQGRLGQAPPLVLPARGSYWKGVLGEALAEGPLTTGPLLPAPRSTKDKLTNAQARLNTMLESRSASGNAPVTQLDRSVSPSQQVAAQNGHAPSRVGQEQTQPEPEAGPQQQAELTDRHVAGQEVGDQTGSPGRSPRHAGGEGNAWQSVQLSSRKAAPRTPSKAQVAAYEIACNPAIRELAIAQSFIRAERQAMDRLAGGGAAAALRPTSDDRETVGITTPPETTAASAAQGDSPHRPKSRNWEHSHWRMTRRMSSRSEGGSFFVSTSALAAGRGEGTEVERGACSGWGPGGGPGGETAMSQASSILKTVMEDLQSEVKTAQQHRMAAEERRDMLQQTSALLSGKLDQLLGDLEEKNQTVCDLRAKNQEVDVELLELEQQLKVRQEQVYAMAEEKRQRHMELAAKEDVITSLQDQLRRFRSTNGRNNKK